ncbi:MAG: hypothetical protein IJQ90_00065 [Alphaproteobacteria bacterium]|nr:hypothetical protein [Alphaproteobacteria bacterium]
MKKDFNAATFDLLKELAQNPDNQVKFNASKDGSQREYVLISPKTDETIFTIEYKEPRLGNAPYICQLIANGSQVKLPQKNIVEIMNILKERHVAKNNTAKFVKEKTEQAALLNWLERFQSKK